MCHYPIDFGNRDTELILEMFKQILKLLVLSYSVIYFVLLRVEDDWSV
jgi:hypothetical protein